MPYSLTPFCDMLSKRDKAVSVSMPAKEGTFMVKNISPHKAKHTPGETVYERYLRTEELLSLQKPEDELAHHDELQFQIVHQVFELWWKETAFELNTIRTLMQGYNVPSALRLLQRVIQIQHLMLSNLRMLETMSLGDFHGFRIVLADGAVTDSAG